jgi:tripartite-type tricarboxylate transporter receptor subunit TctC
MTRLPVAFVIIASLATGLGVARMAAAAPFPAKPVRVIVPQTAGSSADFFARALGEMLSEKWGVPVVVDNRPGAGGSIAMEIVAKATPDGHTVAVTTEGTVAIIPHLYKRLAYDTFSDLAPVMRIASAPYILVIHPALPAKSVKDLIGLAKAKPGTINFASGGNGTGTHLSGELFKLLSGTNLVHVPYKGASLGLTDVIGGQVQMMFVGLPPALGHVKARRLRALGVTTNKRNELLPEVPTIAEGGLAKFEVAPWWGVVAPAQTPPDLIENIRAGVNDIVRTPAYRQRLVVQGAEPTLDTPAEFRKAIKGEYERWGDVIKRAGVRIQ